MKAYQRQWLRASDLSTSALVMTLMVEGVIPFDPRLWVIAVRGNRGQKLQYAQQRVLELELTLAGYKADSPIRAESFLLAVEMTEGEGCDA